MITCAQLQLDFCLAPDTHLAIRTLCPIVCSACVRAQCVTMGSGVRVCASVGTFSRGCSGGRGQHAADRHFPLLSGPISVWQVNGEHKTYLKATFTTWLIPLHCVISRCHISPPHVCLNALPSTLWLVSLGWLPQIHSSRAPHPFTSSLKGKTPYCTFYLGVQQVTR